MSYTFSAFISYRHLDPDTAAAKAVQRAIETYRLPGDIQKKTGIKKLNRCFRDQDEMPLADDLGDSIKKALRESEWLIVICTPDLPESPWCLREVDYFIELERKDHIIPVLVSGTSKESLPPQLIWEETDAGKEELDPLAADLRGSLKKQLKTEKLRIIARMLNLNYNDLKKREKERALRRGLLLVSCILAVVICFAAYAIYKNHLLTEERNATARNATQLLIEKSVRSTSEREIGNGLTYALQAYQGSRMFGDTYNEEIGAALEAAMYPELYSQIGALKDNGILHRKATLSNDGKIITCRQADSSLQIYSSITGEKRFTIRDFGWFGKSSPDLSPDSRYVCRFTEDSVILYSVTDGTEVLAAAIPDGWDVSFYGLTADNRIPLHQISGKSAALYDPFGNELTFLEGISLSGSDKDAVVLHRSGRRGAWSDGTQTWIADTENGEILLTLDAPLGDTWGLNHQGGYTEDQWYFLYRDGDSYVYLRWDTLEEVCRSEYSGVLSPDGTLLASTNGTEGFTLRDALTGKELWRAGHNSGNTLYGLAFADNDTLIASHQELQIYRISDGSVVYDSGSDRTTYGFDVSAGRLVMPLRSGGCLVNLMPEDQDLLPHVVVETRDGVNGEDLAGTTILQPLSGSWVGMNVYSMEDGNSTGTQEQRLSFRFEDQEYILHPVNGFTVPFIYISPDGKWQAMIRDEEVDIFRAEEGPDPVMTIPGNGYQRLCAAISGDILALGAYVENLVLYDLATGECLGSVDTGAMCTKIQFSPDGKHVIAYSAMESSVSVAGTQNRIVIMKIPVTDIYAEPTVGFNRDGTEAVVLYDDGTADVGLLYQNLDTLVEKAQKYTQE